MVDQSKNWIHKLAFLLVSQPQIHGENFNLIGHVTSLITYIAKILIATSNRAVQKFRTNLISWAYTGNISIIK